MNNIKERYTCRCGKLVKSYDVCDCDKYITSNFFEVLKESVEQDVEYAKNLDFIETQSTAYLIPNSCEKCKFLKPSDIHRLNTGWCGVFVKYTGDINKKNCKAIEVSIVEES